MPVQTAASDHHAIEATAITRRFGTVAALDGVSITVRRGEFFSLLGPSGCGKTTFLRVVAGLETPDSGTLRLSGRDILPVPTHLRPVNTVFQSYALFPHLTVQENIAFGLRMKKVGTAERKVRVEKAMELVQITDLAERKPHQISGGQKQRVALARAFVNEPEVLLLDEPLGALDVKLRRQLQEELHALQRRLGVTFLHVTHDQDEALGLSDRVAVMDRGRVVQVGTPSELYESPHNTFVAQFVGGCNLLPATRSDSRTASTALGTLEVAKDLPAGGFLLGFRPERVELGVNATSNCFEGIVADLTYTGPETQITLEVANVALKAVVLNSGGAAPVQVGSRLAIHLPPNALLVLHS
jgi:spermidine/putrescine transport system ATP-binding protein